MQPSREDFAVSAGGGFPAATERPVQRIDRVPDDARPGSARAAEPTGSLLEPEPDIAQTEVR